MRSRRQGMIALHGYWNDKRFALWGEDDTSANVDRVLGEPEGSATEPVLPFHPFAVSVEQLRQIVGDHWDGLLAAGAQPGDGHLRLPTVDGRPDASPGLATESPAPQAGQALASKKQLQAWTVSCLWFGPAEAIDLLLSLPEEVPGVLGLGDSLRFWSRLARLLLDVLAAQRFVPDIVTQTDGTCRAVWRPVLADLADSKQLATLIASMPPVCRSAGPDPTGQDARHLVDDFFATALDAIVRLSLADDPLVTSLEQRQGNVSADVLWLKGLLGSRSAVGGTRQQQVELIDRVRGWVGQLDDVESHAKFRTCFRLNPPELPDNTTSAEDDAEWVVSFHLQATDDPSVLLDAAKIWSLRDSVGLLHSHYQMLAEQLSADLLRASHFFAPLADVIDGKLPTQCVLDTEGAYSFIRECVPQLEVNDFGVLLPEWSQPSRGGLGLRLQLSPAAAVPGGQLGLDALVDYRWRVALGDELLSEPEFRRLCRMRRNLVRLRGRWIEINPHMLKQARDIIEGEPSEPITIFEALRMSLKGTTPSGLAITGIDATGWLQDALNSVGSSRQTMADLKQPEGFCGTMRPYQVKGLSWLAFLDRYGLGGCLADDMGLGKTIQLIALLLEERSRGQTVGPTLLVVPMSLVGNWQREIQRFAPTLKVLVHHGSERLSGDEFIAEVEHHDVVISTYALTHRDFEHLGRVHWHRLALDEAQNIKNPSAKQTKAIRRMRARRRLALTGTPLENHLSELWTIMEFLNPGLLGTAADFRRDFAVPIEKHHRAERGEQLRRLIRPFMLRRRKSDPGVADDLPEKMEMKVYCNLSREQATLYQSVLDEMMGNIEGSAGMRRRGLVLAALTRLKQICNHPACGKEELTDQTILAGRSGKCERLVEMLEEILAEGERTLVFTQFRRMGHLLSRYLGQRLGKEILFLHGGTTARGRDQMVARFQDDDPTVPIFLLSLKAGGFGLNLTSASHVFHFDRWWNPAVEDQASDRVHRIGQTKRVQIHKFVCLGTLEERIDQMLEQKRNLADRIIGGGQTWLTELSTDQLRDVLALSQEAVGED